MKSHLFWDSYFDSVLKICAKRPPNHQILQLLPLRPTTHACGKIKVSRGRICRGRISSMSLGKLDLGVNSACYSRLWMGVASFIEKSVVGKMHFIESCRAPKCWMLYTTSQRWRCLSVQVHRWQSDYWKRGEEIWQFLSMGTFEQQSLIVLEWIASWPRFIDMPAGRTQHKPLFIGFFSWPSESLKY